MRLGPAIWERFTKMIDADDFKLKHHIYSELAALPVKEFNHKMREIMANTKEGKKIIDEIVNSIKTELKEDEFNEAIGAVNNEVIPTEQSYDSDNGNGFDYDELLGKSDDEIDDESDGFNYDDLFK